MENIPFFTVGIPTYNRAAFLREAIPSVLGQTFSDFELIIADNYSDDHTKDTVESFHDSRITYVRHEKNYGYKFNFDFVAQQARGRFFVMLQDDDLLCKSFLERAHECLSKDDSVVMYAAPWWRGSVGDGFGAALMHSQALSAQALWENMPITFPGHDMAVKLLYSFPFRHPSIIIRTEDFKAVGGYDKRSDFIYDILTEVKLLCRGNLIYDPCIGSVDRVHENNISRGISKAQKRVYRSQRYPWIISILEENGVDWLRILGKQIDDMSFGVTLRLFIRFLRKGYVAPPSICRLTWEKINEKNPGTSVWFWGELLSKIGLIRLVRFFLLQ